MTEKFTKGEMHGCIVCGKLYQLYVVRNDDGIFTDAKLMSAGAKLVPHPQRALVACDAHTEEQIERAVTRVYGLKEMDDDD